MWQDDCIWWTRKPGEQVLTFHHCLGGTESNNKTPVRRVMFHLKFKLETSQKWYHSSQLVECHMLLSVSLVVIQDPLLCYSYYVCHYVHWCSVFSNTRKKECVWPFISVYYTWFWLSGEVYVVLRVDTAKDDGKRIKRHRHWAPVVNMLLQTLQNVFHLLVVTTMCVWNFRLMLQCSWGLHSFPVLHSIQW